MAAIKLFCWVLPLSVVPQSYQAYHNCIVWFCLVVFQYSLGGPIIAFQVENEYGSFGEHDLSKEYMAYLKTVREIITVAINNVTLSKEFI